MDESRKALASYRLEQAYRCLKSARLLAEDVLQQIENAEKFCGTIRGYLSSILNK